MAGFEADDRERRRFARRYRAGRVSLYLLTLLAALVAAGSFAWAVITTFKQNSDLYRRRNNSFVFTEPPPLDHVDLLLTGTGFATFALNTLWVGLLVVTITLVLSLDPRHRWLT